MSQHQSGNGPRDPVERKVQLAGNSTFVVSLPKEWALAQELESGISMVDRANDALADALEAIEELDRRLSESDDPDAYRYGTVLESLRRTASIAGNVLAVTSEATVDG